MADSGASFCTDDELLQELKKLGYDSVPPEMFQMMKDDLAELVKKELYSNDDCTLDGSGGLVSSTMQPSTRVIVESNSQVLPGAAKDVHPDRSKKYGPKFFPGVLFPCDEEKVSAVDTFNGKYQSRFSNYNINDLIGNQEPEVAENSAFRDVNENSESSSSSVSSKKIKRKVLRRVGGIPVITEGFVDVPKIFDTSYPSTVSTENKSFSSEDLSWKSNSSTGSVRAVSPNLLSSSRSICSLSTTRSTSRLPNARKKKSDPVTMYNYYKTFWNNFKPPGENTHNKLRWAVRDRMLDYDL